MSILSFELRRYQTQWRLTLGQAKYRFL